MFQAVIQHSFAQVFFTLTSDFAFLLSFFCDANSWDKAIVNRSWITLHSACGELQDFAKETPGFFDEARERNLKQIESCRAVASPLTCLTAKGAPLPSLQVVVCALRQALGCKEKQRKTITDLLGLLYKETAELRAWRFQNTQLSPSNIMTYHTPRISWYHGMSIMFHVNLFARLQMEHWERWSSYPLQHVGRQFLLGASPWPTFLGPGLCHADLYLGGASTKAGLTYLYIILCIYVQHILRDMCA